MKNPDRRRRVRGEFANLGCGNRSVNASQPFDNSRDSWWAHQDSNLGPTDYESAALTAELWARKPMRRLHSTRKCSQSRGRSQFPPSLSQAGPTPDAVRPACFWD